MLLSENKKGQIHMLGFTLKICDYFRTPAIFGEPDIYRFVGDNAQFYGPSEIWDTLTYQPPNSV